MCLHTTESSEQYFPLTLQNQITSLAIHRSHLLCYSQRYYLVLSPCVIPFHEEMLEHQEYPAQVVEWLIHTGKLHQKIKWTCIFDAYGFKPKIINSIMMQLSLRQIPFTWTTLGWFNFIRNFASFFISSSST